MTGDSLYRCKVCKKQFKLSEISKPMNGPLDFVWRSETCPECGASERIDDGEYREIWERVGGDRPADVLRYIDHRGKIEGFTVEISLPRSGKKITLGAEEDEKEDLLGPCDGEGSGIGRCND